jgi:hypothetical protein
VFGVVRTTEISVAAREVAKAIGSTAQAHGEKQIGGIRIGPSASVSRVWARISAACPS